MTTNQYSVTFWGSDPDLQNDDCWYGCDFSSRAEAEQAYAAPVANIRNCPARDVAFIEIDGPDIHAKRANPSFKPAKRSSRDEWASERAMQAGMAFGCDGYNDEMGY